MKNKRPTQAQRILEYIHRFGGITQLEAWSKALCQVKRRQKALNPAVLFSGRARRELEKNLLVYNPPVTLRVPPSFTQGGLWRGICPYKKGGYPIESDTVSVKNRFGEKCHIKRYRLKDVG